ncbi:hypothetical protein [Micromonospora sp. WMMD712]|uniref:hypothetical protein n=1 Tax=Micromonospora sp. WMMD712 TaxID=3016096 RepID=UPI00249B0757|nr:hypothetical protein [Micromonospora sp. WMMD712]WFE55742.1 hypothetical protein O7633_02205 [Micromonospora sp. WMMD712]
MDNSDTVVFARVGGDATDPTGPAEPDDDRAPASPAAAGPDGDLTAALAAAAPRRWWNRGTVVLGALVLVVAGFVGGVQVQQRWGEPAAGAAASSWPFPAGLANGAAGMGRGQGGTGQDGQPSAGASASAGTTTGTVTLVDGDTLYVETADGTVVTVRTTDDTAVRTTRASKLTAIERGQRVTVQGGALTDNAMTATSVTAGG